MDGGGESGLESEGRKNGGAGTFVVADRGCCE